MQEQSLYFIYVIFCFQNVFISVFIRLMMLITTHKQKQQQYCNSGCILSISVFLQFLLFIGSLETVLGKKCKNSNKILLALGMQHAFLFSISSFPIFSLLTMECSDFFNSTARLFGILQDFIIRTNLIFQKQFYVTTVLEREKIFTDCDFYYLETSKRNFNG